MASTGEVVDVPTELMRYTAEVTTRFTFGDDLPALDHGGEGLEPYLAQMLPTLNRRCQALVP